MASGTRDVCVECPVLARPPPLQAVARREVLGRTTRERSLVVISRAVSGERGAGARAVTPCEMPMAATTTPSEPVGLISARAHGGLPRSNLKRPAAAGFVSAFTILRAASHDCFGDFRSPEMNLWTRASGSWWGSGPSDYA